MSPNRASARGCGPGHMRVTKVLRSGKVWKVLPQRVKVPYAKRKAPSSGYQSSTEPVKLRVKLGGPPPKAKYSLATDSVKVG